MALVWDESFVLGIDEIDEQHRKLVEQFTRFSEAIQEGSDVKILSEMTDFMVEYAQFHFTTEERYMQLYDYPGIAGQLSEHAEFTRYSEDLVQRIRSEGASREISLALAGKMVRWLIRHIRSFDREMVDFIKKRMANES